MMSGSGTTTVTSAVNFTGAGNIYLYERTFNNTGVATWDKAGYVNIQTSAVINNQAGATFTVQSSGEYIVSGSGTFKNSGTLNLTTGKINASTFIQEASGITNLAIKGTTPVTEYSQLYASYFYLAGPLNISFVGGYTPHLGSHFMLLWYDNPRTGEFSPMIIPPPIDSQWYIYYRNNALHLVATVRMLIPMILK
jgi:hypothetical protein